MQVYIGIDWSEKKHDIAFQNSEGGEILHRTVAHTLRGLEEFDALRQKFQVTPQD